VIIINKGTIVAEDTPDNLRRRHTKSSRSRLVVRAPLEEAKSVLAAIDGVLTVEAPSGTENGVVKFVVDARPETDVRAALSRAVVEKGWDLLELTSLDVSLEDVFIDLVTEEGEEGGSTKDAERKGVA
jgi:ABC-2 type transport system ATP-binding protein